MTKLRFILLLSAGISFLSAPALAQTFQSGTVTPGHLTRWVAAGFLGDACTSSGSQTTLGVGSCGTDLGLQGPLGLWDGPSLGNSHQWLFSWIAGVPTMTLNTFGTATPPTQLNVVLNGVTYPFPGPGVPGTGTVVGPPTTIVGDMAVWNSTTGTLLKDVPVPTRVSLGAAPGTGKNVVTDYGADPTGVIDSSTAVQNAVNDAAGKMPVFFPAGLYKLCTLITTANPLWLVGAGPGSGPGLLNTGFMTQINLCGTTQSGFQSTSFAQSIFENFALTGPVQTAGIGIQLIPSGTATNEASIFRNLALGSTNFGVQGLFDPVQIVRPSWPLFDHILCMGWVAECISEITTTGIEGSGGWITHSHFMGNAAIFGSGQQGPNVYSEVGYIELADDTFLAGTTTLQFNIKNNAAGFIHVHNSSIENCLNYCITVGTADGSAVGMVMFQNNEFSNISFTANMTAEIAILEYDVGGISQKYLDSADISNNVHRTVMPGAAQKYVWVQTGKSVSVHNERVYDLGTHNPTCIQMTGSLDSSGFTVPLSVLDNACVATAASPYNLSGLVQVRDTSGLTFTNTPTVVANGSQVFMSDGLPGSNPCAGGSTGAMAFRQNGQYKC